VILLFLDEEIFSEIVKVIDVAYAQNILSEFILRG